MRVGRANEGQAWLATALEGSLWGHIWIGYSIAVAGTVVAACVRWWLADALGTDFPPYLTFYPVIIVSAFLGGTGAGLLATALSAGLVDYLFLLPLGFGIERFGGVAALILFTAINLVLSVGGGALRMALRRTLRSEHQHRQTLESIPAHVAVVNRSGQILAVNAAWAEFASQNGAETSRSVGVGANYLEVCRNSAKQGDHDADKALAGIEAVLTGGTRQFSLEYSCHSPTEQRWFLMTVVHFKANGKSGAVITHTNISSLKNAEEARRQSEQRLRLAQQAAHLGTFEWNVQTGINIWSTELEAMYGLKPGEFGRTQSAWRELVHPDDRASAVAAVEHALETFQPEEAEWRVVWPDGSVHWLVGRFQAFKDRAGNLKRLVGVNLEVSERKRVQLELAEARDRLAAELAAMNRLHELGTRLAREQDLHSLLENVLDAAIATAGADKGNIQLLAKTTGELQINVQRGFGDEFVEFYSQIHSGEAACGTAMRSRKCVVVEDITRSPIFLSQARALELKLAAGVRAVTCTPMLTRSGQLVGVLSVHFGTPHRPSDRDLHLLELLARQAADLIERTRKEEALRRAHDRVETILRSITDSFITIDHEWRFTYVNAEAERTLRQPAAELLGCSVWERFPEADEFRKEYEQAMASGQTRHFEQFYGPLQTWFEVHAYPSPDGLSIYFRDVSERRRAAEALSQNEERFRVLANTIPQLAWWANPDGYITWYNDNWYRYTGTTPQEMEGWGWQRVHDPEQLPKVLEGWKASIATGEPFNMVFPLRGADRRFRSFLTRVQPLKDEHGRVLQWFGTNTDVSELLEVQAALRQSEEHLRLAAVAANIGVWSWKPGTNRVFVGGSWRKLFGIGLEAPVTFETWRDAIHPEDRERAVRELNEASQQCREYNCEYRIVRADGNIRWIIDRGHTSYAENGQVLNMAGVNVDITEQKEAQEILARNNDQLEQLVRERTAKLQETVDELEHFSYTITHDMRAPLRAMKGFGEVLLDECGECLHGERRDLLRRIADAAERMDHLISDALQYSRAVRTNLELRPLDPAVLLGGIVDSYPQLQTPHAEIHIEKPMPMVMGNEAGLTQCFSNLLDNAVKFVSPGVTPQVRVWATWPSAPGERVCIFFQDNGIGILPQHYEKIFSMFQKLDKSYEGTGIGLALVRKVAQRMGGQAGVVSNPGQGSRFWLEVNAAIQSTDAQSTAPICGG